MTFRCFRAGIIMGSENNEGTGRIRERDQHGLEALLLTPALHPALCEAVLEVWPPCGPPSHIYPARLLIIH